MNQVRNPMNPIEKAFHPTRLSKTLRNSRRGGYSCRPRSITRGACQGADTLRVGMIGCGGRNAGAAVQALRADKGARLTAMCDIFMDRVRAKRSEIRNQQPDQVQADDDHCFAGFDGYKHVIENSDVVLIAKRPSSIPFTPGSDSSWETRVHGKTAWDDPAGVRS